MANLFSFLLLLCAFVNLGLLIFFSDSSGPLNLLSLCGQEKNNYYRVFSHDVTAAILVSQNNEMAAMLVSQTNPLGVELFSYAKAFFCFNKFA